MLQSAVRAGNVRNKSNESEESFRRQGSLRRVLPPENKETLFGRQNEDINQFYKIVRQEYIILAEYKMLLSENLKGIYVIPSKESSFVWFGVLFVRSGVYEDGIFRFNITLPENFPDGGHPKVVFQTEVYHPVINKETNELNLLGGFPVWNKTEQHIWQVLKYIQWVFHSFNASLPHAVNQEAAKLYKEDEQKFKEKVSHLARLSKDSIYDPPPVTDKHYLTFEKYIPEIHDPVRSTMLVQGGEDRSVLLGPSWVSAGDFKPLSRPPSPSSESDA